MGQIIEKNLSGNLKLRVVEVTPADLVVAATSKAVPLGAPLPAGAEVIDAWTDLKTVFASGSITALACEVGQASDTDAFVTSGELLSGPPSTGRRHVRGAWITADGKQLNAKFTSTGANLGDGSASALTAGRVDVFILYLVTPTT